MSQPCRFLDLNSSTVSIYVDGSYHPDCNLSSYSFVALEGGQRVMVHSEKGTLYNKLYNSSAAELVATIKAVRWALKQGYKKINILFDYIGIRSLLRHQFKGHKHPLFSLYKEYMRKYATGPNRRIFLHKVKAHKGLLGNEMADQLAKTAIFKSWKDKHNNPWKFLAKKWFSIFTHSIPAMQLYTRVYKIPKEVDPELLKAYMETRDASKPLPKHHA